VGIPNLVHGQGIKPASALQFIINSNEESVLHWQVATSEALANPVCQVRDYNGGIIKELEVAQTGRDLKVLLALEKGYYTVTLPQRGTFGLLVVSKSSASRDQFFGMDAALSWLRGIGVHQDMIHVMDRIGVAIARERLAWGDIEAKKATWSWSAKREYEKTRALYAADKIGVLEIFHDSPSWMQDDKKTVFPNDLPVAAKSWETIARRWGQYWQGIEVWNEADIMAGQGGPQAEQYVPIVKAVRYAFQEAGCIAPVGGGVFAYLTRPYMDLAAENGLLQASDFISFHYYSEPMSLENYVSEYRNYLRTYGQESMPLWLTESGSPWLGGPNERPDTQTGRNTALRFAELATEAKACGIARYFPFVLVAYTEHGNKNFGMLDRQGAPLPSLAAYAQAIEALSHADYIGDINLDDKTLRARVFGKDDGSATIVISSGSIGGASVRLTFPIVDVRGIDGRQLAMPVSGSLNIADGLIYVNTKLDDVGKCLKTDTLAMSLTALSREPQSVRQPVSPIIIVPSVKSATLTASIRGYEVPEGMTELPVQVRVINMSAKPEVVHLMLRGNAENHQEGDGTHEEVSVPPESFVDISKSLDIATMTFDKQGRGIMRITGTAAGDEKILPAALFFARSLGLDGSLSAYSYRFSLPITDFTRWTENGSGPMHFAKSADGNWSFSIVYGPGDRWGFPKFNVPQEVDLERIVGVIVRARCASQATVRLMTWPKAPGNGFSTTGYSIFKADGKWHVVYIPLADFLKAKGNGKLGSQIGQISVGISDRESKENTVEVSDLILVGN
jgi:hypothetical protein